MRDNEKTEKVTAAFRTHFMQRPASVEPSAEWRRKLDSRLTDIRLESGGDLSFARYEKQIWRAGWISFAASMAALLLFSLLNVYAMKQSTVDDAISHLYGNIMVENEL